MPSAVEAWSFNHWTTREVPTLCLDNRVMGLLQTTLQLQSFHLEESGNLHKLGQWGGCLKWESELVEGW